MRIVLKGNGRRIVLRQTGARGQTGPQGPQGIPGQDGQGLPVGGTSGQVPVKQSSTDFDIAWETPPAAPVTSVNGQTGVVTLDARDVGAVEGVYAGSNISVDNTDPHNPVVSSDGSVKLHASINVFPEIGDEGYLYIADDTGVAYRWVDGAYLEQRGSVFEDFSDVSEFTVVSSGVILAEDEYIRNGYSSLSVTTSGTEACIVEKVINSSVSSNGNVRLWVYIPSLTGLAHIAFELSSREDFSSKFRRQISAPGILHEGWNLLSFSSQDWANAGSESWTNTFVRMRVEVGGIDAATPTVIFDSSIADRTYRAKCLVTFDDGRLSSYTRGFAYMETLGIKGTQYMIGDFVGNDDFLSLSQCQELYDAGWDLGVHGSVDLRTLTKQEQKDDILSNKKFLTDNGFYRGDLHYAYPYGYYNESSLAAFNELNFRTARTTKDRTQAQYLDERYLITRHGVYPGTTISQFRNMIDRAINRGDAILLNYHQIVDSDATSGTMVLTDQFHLQMDYIKQKVDEGLIDTQTISEWYEGLERYDKIVAQSTDSTDGGDAVMTSGNQTISGVKTFVEPISIGGPLLMSGNGTPLGMIVAPMGSIYIDKEATNGAYSWIKKSGAGNTGWSVLEGDTGWRNINSLAVPGSITNGTVSIRRINNRVLIRNNNVSVSSDGTPIIASMSAVGLTGFNPVDNTEVISRMSSSMVPTYAFSIQPGSATAGLRRFGNPTAAYTSTGWDTIAPWPTTLPGTPA